MRVIVCIEYASFESTAKCIFDIQVSVQVTVVMRWSVLFMGSELVSKCIHDTSELLYNENIIKTTL